MGLPLKVTKTILLQYKSIGNFLCFLPYSCSTLLSYRALILPSSHPTLLSFLKDLVRTGLLKQCLQHCIQNNNKSLNSVITILSHSVHHVSYIYLASSLIFCTCSRGLLGYDIKQDLFRYLQKLLNICCGSNTK